MVNYDIIAILEDFPKEAFKGEQINFNFIHKGNEVCQGIIRPFGSLNGENLTSLIQGVSNAITFRDWKQVEVFRNMLADLKVNYETHNPIAILHIVDMPIDVEEKDISDYVELNLTFQTMALSFNYSLPIVIRFFILVNKETHAIAVRPTFKALLLEGYKRDDQGTIIHKEDNFGIVNKIIEIGISEHFHNEPYLIKALDLFRVTLHKKFEDRIPDYWTIFNILAGRVGTADVKILFEKYLPEKADKVAEFSDVRGAWHHFRAAKTGFNLVKESHDMRECVEAILVKKINERHEEIKEMFK